MGLHHSFKKLSKVWAFFVRSNSHSVKFLINYHIQNKSKPRCFPRKTDNKFNFQRYLDTLDLLLSNSSNIIWMGLITHSSVRKIPRPYLTQSNKNTAPINLFIEDQNSYFNYFIPGFTFTIYLFLWKFLCSCWNILSYEDKMNKFNKDPCEFRYKI